jgi:hypothetical protein
MGGTAFRCRDGEIIETFGLSNFVTAIGADEVASEIPSLVLLEHIVTTMGAVCGGHDTQDTADGS